VGYGGYGGPSNYAMMSQMPVYKSRQQRYLEKYHPALITSYKDDGTTA